MNIPHDAIEKEFVDREPAINDYKGMSPVGDSPRILCIEADPDMGKTWLLKRLFRDSQSLPLLRAIVDCNSADATDEEKLLKRIARDMGGPIQTTISAAGQALVGERQVNIQAGRDVNIGGDVALNKVTVNNYGNAEHLTVDLTDIQGRDDRILAMTEGLKKGLNALIPPMWAVLFLDHFEKATKETRRWLVEKLFYGLQTNEIPNLIVVVASVPPVDCFMDRDWNYVVLSHKLEGMDVNAVKEYWRKRQIPEDGMPFILTVLFSGGNPSPKKMCTTLTDYKENLPNQTRGIYAAG